MSWTVVEVDGNGVRETRKGGTLAGGEAAETKQKPKPKMVTLRLCVRPNWGVWCPSGEIPDGLVALEAQTRPVETIKQVPEG